MKNQNPDVLSEETVNSILLQAWELSSSQVRMNGITDLKVSDWDILSEDIKILWESQPYANYKLPAFTGEAYIKAFQKKAERSMCWCYLF